MKWLTIALLGLCFCSTGRADLDRPLNLTAETTAPADPQVQVELRKIDALLRHLKNVKPEHRAIIKEYFRKKAGADRAPGAGDRW